MKKKPIFQAMSGDECHEKKQEALEKASELFSRIARETYDSKMESLAKEWLRSYRGCVFLFTTMKG